MRACASGSHCTQRRRSKFLPDRTTFTAAARYVAAPLAEYETDPAEGHRTSACGVRLGASVFARETLPFSCAVSSGHRDALHCDATLNSRWYARCAARHGT